MKTLREKFKQNEALTLGEWSTLVGVKIFSLSICMSTFAGMGLLLLKAGLLSGDADYLVEIGGILTVLGCAEGAPKIALKVHDKVLTWIEQLEAAAN